MARKLKIQLPKREETTLERQNYWINRYRRTYGMGVECSNCQKWRQVMEFKETHHVPEYFVCSMTYIDGKIGSCDMPETIRECDLVADKYMPGSVVWAKCSSFPWWPAIVEDSPDIEEYLWEDKGLQMYHVTFFGKKATHNWVEERNVCPFLEPPKFQLRKKYLKDFKIATEQAEVASSMDIEERLVHYSLAVLYKGKWPKADNFDAILDDSTTDGNETSTDPQFLGSVANEEMMNESANSSAGMVSSDNEMPAVTAPPVPDHVVPDNSTPTEGNEERFILDQEDSMDIENPVFQSYKYFTKIM